MYWHTDTNLKLDSIFNTKRIILCIKMHYLYTQGLSLSIGVKMSSFVQGQNNVAALTLRVAIRAISDFHGRKIQHCTSIQETRRDG